MLKVGIEYLEKRMPRKKRKSTVNKAGNYTKPTMRRDFSRGLRLVLKVVNPVNGQLEKPSF